jgi:Phosphoesterase family
MLRRSIPREGFGRVPCNPFGGGISGRADRDRPIISPFVRPGSVNDHRYNHYALPRSIEDLFGLEHLGFAAQPGLPSFGNSA